MRRFSRFALFVAAAACGGSDSTAPKAPRGIQFVAGANVTDTVVAPLGQALIVEVRDSTGAVAPLGTVVRFTAVPHSPSTATEVTLQSLGSNSYTAFATGTTDQSGRTAVLVRLGTFAGAARLAIAVPTLELNDTARYTVLPGAAARVAVAPTDTVLYVGGTFNIRGGVVDQFGNTRDDGVTFNTTGTGLSVSGSGSVSASGIGRFTVTATAKVTVPTSPAASLAVSVVPQARLVMWKTTTFPGSIALVDMDGSHLKTLNASVADGGVGVHPVWMPNGSAVLYTALVGSLETLQLVDTNGVVTNFISPTVSTMTHQAEATPTVDGQWVFFSAYDSRCISGAGYCLFRSKPDGSSPQLFAKVAGGNPRPAPAPDGGRVAYTTGSFGTMRVFDVASNTTSTWTQPADQAAWSPDGTQIAIVSNGALSLIKPDGTGLRVLSTPSRTYFSNPLSWTKDSRYLLARASAGVYDLIDTRDGSSLPLAFTSGTGAVSIR